MTVKNYKVNIRMGWLLIVLLSISSCKENINSEIVDRWDNGAKKTVVTYRGTTENRDIISEKIYSSTGELFKIIQHPTKDTILFGSEHRLLNSSLVGTWEMTNSEIISNGQSVESKNENEFEMEILPDGKYTAKHLMPNIDAVYNVHGLIFHNKSHRVIPIYTQSLRKKTNNNYLYTLDFILDKQGKITTVRKSYYNDQLIATDTNAFKTQNYPKIYLKQDTLIQVLDAKSVVYKAYFLKK